MEVRLVSFSLSLEVRASVICAPGLSFKIWPEPQSPVSLGQRLAQTCCFIEWFFFSHLMVVLCTHTPSVGSLVRRRPVTPWTLTVMATNENLDRLQGLHKTSPFTHWYVLHSDSGKVHWLLFPFIK